MNDAQKIKSARTHLRKYGFSIPRMAQVVAGNAPPEIITVEVMRVIGGEKQIMELPCLIVGEHWGRNKELVSLTK